MKLSILAAAAALLMSTGPSLAGDNSYYGTIVIIWAEDLSPTGRALRD